MLASQPLGMHSPQIKQPSPAKGLSAPMTGHRAALAKQAGGSSQGTVLPAASGHVLGPAA